MIVLEVRDDELVSSLQRQVKEAGIENAAIVSLIGGVEDFTISTMPLNDATSDTITTYHVTAEMTGNGEVVDGKVHLHAVMGVQGDEAKAGHLHQATVKTHFARAYVIPTV
ncbi:PCC domain-containing protein [Promicromonospora sp. NFX87]|uniref:PCC domain-containing protein n=1 Tax=Promicromonospora sp. NFX87 TaxID=3402691 RepID=UPI003AFACCF4